MSILDSALKFVQAALPLLKGSQPLIASAVEIVTEIAPLVARTYQDAKPKVIAIIEALRADDATNLDQLAKLREAEKILDAEFDAAADKAIEEDAEDEASGG